MNLLIYYVHTERSDASIYKVTCMPYVIVQPFIIAEVPIRLRCLSTNKHAVEVAQWYFLYKRKNLSLNLQHLHGNRSVAAVGCKPSAGAVALCGLMSKCR